MSLSITYMLEPLSQWFRFCGGGLAACICVSMIELLPYAEQAVPPEVISIFGCGRKSFQLDARFRELLGAVQSLGIGGSMYHSGGAGMPVNIVNDKDQLIPYRQLDASRLKIVGSGNWD